MKLASYPLDVFFDLIADMPDIEGVEEIDTRLQSIADERKALVAFGPERNSDREALNLHEDTLRVHRAKIIYRIEQRKWSKAVRAVFGDEGFERCVLWMRNLPEDGVKAIPMSHSKAIGGRR